MPEHPVPDDEDPYSDRDPEVQRIALSLIVAELDGAGRDVGATLLHDADRDFLAELAEHLAELLCDHVIDREDDRTEEIRAAIQADLLRLAQR